MIKFVLENFDTIFKSKDSLENLDKLILDLAIKGKLVEQNPNDEPASELLKRIKEEKQRLIDEKIIKKEKPLPPIEEDEKPFKIPSNWEWVRLGDIGDLQTGNTPATNIKEYFGNDISFITPADIYNDKIIYSNRGLSFLGKEVGRVAVKNSILQVCIGGSIGKSFYIDKDVCFNQQINSISLRKCNYKFIHTILISDYFYSELIKNSKGTATPIINKSNWGKLIIPLPPAEEQKRIVEKVEKLQQLTKKLKEIYISNEDNRQLLKKSVLLEIENSGNDKELLKNLEIIFSNFDKIVKTKEDIKDIRNLILSLAIKGKLVEQNPNDEPASELLKRIKEEKQRLIDEKIIKKEKPLPPIEEDEKPFKIPSNWEWSRLSYFTLINGGFAFKSSKYTKQGVRVIRISDFDENGFKNNNIVYYKYEKSLEKYLIKEKDILMCMTGGTVGKTMYVCKLSEPLLVNQRVADIKSFIIDEKYLYYVLSTKNIKDIIEISKNSTNDNISMKMLEELLIPLPPIEEQKRIVEKVENLMKICDSLESKLILNEKISENLLKSINNN